jgi:hypothetical protein
MPTINRHIFVCWNDCGVLNSASLRLLQLPQALTPTIQVREEKKMDEASQKLRHAPAELQGLPPGAVLTEAKRLARNAVKAQYQARGLKFYTTPSSEIARAVRTYLDAHQAELVSQARANITNRAQRLKR